MDEISEALPAASEASADDAAAATAGGAADSTTGSHADGVVSQQVHLIESEPAPEPEPEPEQLQSYTVPSGAPPPTVQLQSSPR